MMAFRGSTRVVCVFSEPWAGYRVCKLNREEYVEGQTRAIATSRRQFAVALKFIAVLNETLLKPRLENSEFLLRVPGYPGTRQYTHVLRREVRDLLIVVILKRL